MLHGALASPTPRGRAVGAVTAHGAVLPVDLAARVDLLIVDRKGHRLSGAQILGGEIASSTGSRDLSLTAAGELHPDLAHRCRPRKAPVELGIVGMRRRRADRRATPTEAAVRVIFGHGRTADGRVACAGEGRGEITATPPIAPQMPPDLGGGIWGSFGGRLGVGGGSLPFDMPASEAASATYQRAHWPRLYGALVSCGTVFAEVDAKIEDLWTNFGRELSFYQRNYLRNVAVPWKNLIQHGLKYNLRVSHHYLKLGLKIIETINNIYATIAARRRQHDVKHRHLCVCHLCYIESE